MNIFFLDQNPIKAAQFLCNKHVVKMGVESCQLLSQAHHICPNTSVNYDKLYNLGWQNHPCARWVRESTANYRWLWDHTTAIFDEYYYRYGRVHACISKGTVDELKQLPNLHNINFTQPHLGMPDDCKIPNYVEAYRNYYRYYKLRKIDVRYTRREWPEWLK